jgi:hypothetical protein
MVISTPGILAQEDPSEIARLGADTENCLLCHRYPNMGRFDESGQKRIFYVNADHFAHSVHRKLQCKSCHVGLDKIPHTDVKKVDCTTKCHIREPSSNREFSHENMAQKYRNSVHGRTASEGETPYPEDLPTCKYCHDNRSQDPQPGLWGMSQELANETLARCIGCHTKENWAENFYAHFTQRMRRIRSQTEIIRLCTGCHEDEQKMTRHGLETVETFKDTFHWNLVKFGVKDAPDCISCHVPLGYSSHDIKPRSDPASSIHQLNRVDTCSNQGGIQSCHPGATPQFASGRVHLYGSKAQIAAWEQLIEIKEPERKSLLVERAQTEFSEQEIFRQQVLTVIRIFYKVLIVLVIGSMAFHQWLDFWHIMWNRRKAKRSARR